MKNAHLLLSLLHTVIDSHSLSIYHPADSYYLSVEFKFHTLQFGH